MNDMQTLTNSQGNTFKMCARKHFFAYELGLRRIVDAQPLRFGSAFAFGLDRYRQGKYLAAEIIADTVRQYDAHRPSNDDDWLIEREQIARLLVGYFWRWARMDQSLTILATELPFDMPLINPETGRASRLFTVAGVIDAIVKLPDGRIAIMEDKTSGQSLDVNSDYWKRLRIDSQISIYWRAAEQLGYDVATVLYDVIRKPSIRPRKLTLVEKAGIKDSGRWYGELATIPADGRETPQMYGARLRKDMADRPDFYFARREIPRLQTDLQESDWDVWQTAKMIRECQKHNRWPRNTTACVGFGRCTYFDLCTDGFDPGTVPHGFEKVDDVHPELQPATAGEEVGK